jgi:8-oxo-dGTP diphosphatase
LIKAAKSFSVFAPRGRGSGPATGTRSAGASRAAESLEEALIREIREEVGVRPTRFELVAKVREKRPDLYGNALHHVYAVTEWEGDPANTCDEHTELKWFSLEEMRRLTHIVDSDYARFAELGMR